MNDFTNNLPAIAAQLASCKFECQAGPLENNTAFQELQRIAALPGIYDRNRIIEYLDNQIGIWRRNRRAGSSIMASHYVDAFQSIRIAIAGEILPVPEGEPADPEYRVIGHGEDAVNHSIEDDFEHFLVTHGHTDLEVGQRAALFEAYSAAWEPAFTRMSDEVIAADGKFYRVMNDREHADFVWGNDGSDPGALDVSQEEV